MRFGVQKEILEQIVTCMRALPSTSLVTQFSLLARSALRPISFVFILNEFEPIVFDIHTLLARAATETVNNINIEVRYMHRHNDSAPFASTLQTHIRTYCTYIWIYLYYLCVASFIARKKGTSS